MHEKKILETSILCDILFAYDICDGKISILNGENNEKKHHSVSGSNSTNLNILEKMNYLLDKNYSSKIKKMFYELNEISKTYTIKFAGNATFKTSYIQIIDENKNLSDFRIDGHIRITLSDKNNFILYSDLPFLDNVDIMINNIKKEYFLLLKKSDINSKNNIALQNKKYNIILSSKASAFLIHEIFGHMLEGDYIYNTSSIFSEYRFGDKLISKNISILDDPTLLDYHIGVGKYDDDGELIKPVTLIEKGFLTGYILNNEYSKKLNIKTQIGCSRRQSYRHSAIPRMRNTFLCNNQKTNINYNYMKNNIDTGIFIDSIFSGAINPITGDFFLNCSKGEYIKNGNTIGSTGNITISDNILNVLKNIDVVGNDFQSYIGKCIKAGQIVTVGMGSPSMKIDNLQTIIGGLL